MAEPTELDKYEPHGIPIHPYDFYELLNAGPGKTSEGKFPPRAIDEADYLRNINKVGHEATRDGTDYFVTTSVDWKSTRFEEYRRQA